MIYATRVDLNCNFKNVVKYIVLRKYQQKCNISTSVVLRKKNFKLKHDRLK